MTPSEERFARLVHAAERRAKTLPVPPLAAGAVFLTALVAANYGFGISPRPTGAMQILPTMAFFPAVAVAGYLRGRASAWLVATGSMMTEWIVIPPAWSLAIDQQFWPWFAGFCLSLGFVAAASSRGAEPHAPDQGVSERQRLIIGRGFKALRAALGQDVVE